MPHSFRLRPIKKADPNQPGKKIDDYWEAFWVSSYPQIHCLHRSAQEDMHMNHMNCRFPHDVAFRKASQKGPLSDPKKLLDDLFEFDKVDF